MMKDLRIHLSRILVLVLLSSFVLVSCNDDEGEGTVVINVSINWENQPFILNNTYTTESGDVSIEDFKFYLSNIVLSSDGVRYVQPESYHLVRANEEGTSFEITLEGVPAASYNQITYGIGVDPDKNLSIDNEGDLDPTNQMAWNWDTGYKFVLCEGKLNNAELGTIGLIYHIGFSENYFEKTDNIESFIVDEDRTSVIVMNVEVDEMFKNPNEIDITTLNNVMFNKEEVNLFVENYKNGMFGF